MSVLLDTHSFLWFTMGSPKLSVSARTLIEEEGRQRLLSMASVWEMAIKVSLGKLHLAAPFDALISEQTESNAIDILDVELSHLAALIALPFHHRDPFDRLLVAQCLVEKLPIISADLTLDTYGIERLW